MLAEFEPMSHVTLGMSFHLLKLGVADPSGF